MKTNKDGVCTECGGRGLIMEPGRVVIGKNGKVSHSESASLCLCTLNRMLKGDSIGEKPVNSGYYSVLDDLEREDLEYFKKNRFDKYSIFEGSKYEFIKMAMSYAAIKGSSNSVLVANGSEILFKYFLPQPDGGVTNYNEADGIPLICILFGSESTNKILGESVSCLINSRIAKGLGVWVYSRTKESFTTDKEYSELLLPFVAKAKLYSLKSTKRFDSDSAKRKDEDRIRALKMATGF